MISGSFFQHISNISMFATTSVSLPIKQRMEHDDYNTFDITAYQ